ncbi:hypothetical protein MMC07_006625 [Pseudocyphellaria aurata]|nr:hypothetical protein [Pseudocyphellaria aurata]
MTESINPSIQKTDVENKAPEDKVQDIAATPNQSMSTARGRNQADTTRTRNWIVYLPPEIRSMIYRLVLQEAVELSTDWLPAIVRHSGVQGLPGLFFTSKLIHRESVEAFHHVNAFYIRSWVPTLTIGPSRRLSDMIQNVRIKFTLSVVCKPHHSRFVDVIRTFGDPGVIRGTLFVQLVLYPRVAHCARPSLQFYLRGLGRFTNFRVVEVEIYYIQRPDLSTAAHYRGVETALRHVLGPATCGPLRNGRVGLTFFPRQFLNRQPLQEKVDWINHLGEIYFDGNGEKMSSPTER